MNFNYIPLGQIKTYAQKLSKTNMFNLEGWLKKALNYFNITTADPCCPTTISPIRYNETTGDLEYYNQTTDTWDITITNSWELLGNVGTDPLTNFIGTTDSAGVMFRINNENAGYLQADKTAFGYNAGTSETGERTTHIGVNAGFGNAADYVVSIGLQSGYQNTGANSTFLGTVAGKANQGDNSTFVGTEAGISNTGSNSVGIGVAALSENIGHQSSAIGLEAGRFNEGDDLCALGAGAGKGNTGDYVLALGAGAGESNTGNNLCALGVEAGAINTGDNVLALGTGAGKSNTLSNVLIVGIDNLPSFENAAAAAAVLPVASASGVYLYWDTSDNTIKARP
jgi:hypothetical protein